MWVGSTQARSRVRAKTDPVEDLELLEFDEGLEGVKVDLVGDLVGEVEEVESKREGGGSEDEGSSLDSKSNEGEEAKELASVRGVGEGGWKTSKRMHINTRR